MNLGRPLGPTARRILRPGRWILYASYLLAWILTLWSTLLPGAQILPLILLSLGWAAVLAGSLLHETLRLITRRIYRQPTPRPNPDKRLLMRGRIACAIAFTLIGLQVPFRLAFAISRPSLERHVMHHYAEVPYDTPLPGPHLCGLLPVHIVRISPTKVTIWIIGGGYLHYLGTDDGPTANTSWWAEHRIAPHWHTSRFHY
jgi:hypothetical protein